MPARCRRIDSTQRLNIDFVGATQVATGGGLVTTVRLARLIATRRDLRRSHKSDAWIEVRREADHINPYPIGPAAVEAAEAATGDRAKRIALGKHLLRDAGALPAN